MMSKVQRGKAFTLLNRVPCGKFNRAGRGTKQERVPGVKDSRIRVFKNRKP